MEKVNEEKSLYNSYRKKDEKVKKKAIFIICGIVLAIVIAGVSFYFGKTLNTKCDVDDEKPKEREVIKNVKEKEIKGTKYYVMTGEYKGEYGYQTLYLNEEFDSDTTRDTIKLYNSTEVMSYEDLEKLVVSLNGAEVKIGEKFKYFGYKYTNGWALIEYNGQTFDIELSDLITICESKCKEANIKRIYCMSQSCYNKYKEQGFIITKNSNDYYRLFENELWLVYII